MTRQFLPLPFLLLALTISLYTQVWSQKAEPPWVKPIQLIEQRHAKELLAINDSLLKEMDAQIKRLLRDGDLEGATRLKVRREALALETENVKLGAKGQAPSAAEVETRRVAREATGKHWKLEGTTNVKRITFDGSKVVAVSPDGFTTANTLAEREVAPGVYASTRKDGQAGYYLFSPDLKRVLGLIVDGQFDGTLQPAKPKP